MGFCSKCGKEIADGEVCSCQSGAEATNSTTKQAKEAATGVIGSALDIVSDPVGGVARFLETSTWIRTIILVAVSYVIGALEYVVNCIKANADRIKDLKEYADDWDMDLDDYLWEFDIDKYVYTPGDIIKGEIRQLLITAAIVAITAVIVFFAYKLLCKVTISWKRAFAVASITYLVTIPIGVVQLVLGLIPTFKLLSWIISMIGAFSVAACAMLKFVAYKTDIEDTKKTIYSYVCIAAVLSFANSFITFLINAIFNF